MPSRRARLICAYQPRINTIASLIVRADRDLSGIHQRNPASPNPVAIPET